MSGHLVLTYLLILSIKYTYMHSTYYKLRDTNESEMLI